MKAKKILGIILAFIMIISNGNIAMANENAPAAETKNAWVSQNFIDEENIIQFYRFALNNSSEIRIEDHPEKRIAEYFVNDVKKQISVFHKSTGDIYYYDLSGQAVSYNSCFEDDNLLSKPYTSKYNIKDFLQINSESTYGIQADNPATVNDSDDFKYLTSKDVTISNETYKRKLYGYTDSKQYRQNSWHYPAGTAASIISSVCGLLPGVGPALSIITSAAGITISAFTVQEWVKELFWVYKFVQTSPSKMDFICSGEFMYEKQHKVEINGDIGYWETIETKSDREIERIRDDILTYPGYYI